ncbi:MAG: acyltransferase family protein [Planctomycetes bacterium]|nr:acyltransferase family protein [Planctomycetota bacterium]
MKSPTSNQLIWVENTKIIAAFAVVILHVSGNLLAKASLGNLEWWAADIYNSFVRWCVPVFIMTSGFLLLKSNKTESISSFYRRKFPRILIPLIFWSLFYRSILAAKGLLSGEPISIMDFIRQFSSPYYHLWYLYMLAIAYLFIPFAKKLIRNLTTNETLTLCVLMFCLAAVNSALNAFLFNNNNVLTNWLLLSPPYLLAGHLIGNANHKKFTTPALLVFILSGLLTAIGCYFLTRITNLDKGQYFYSYTSITVIPMSIAIFYLLGSIKSYVLSKAITQKTAKISFGIYLAHPFFIQIMLNLGFDATLFNPIVSIPLIVLLLFVSAAISSTIIDCIPHLKRIIG